MHYTASHVVKDFTSADRAINQNSTAV